jgi:hypothetical protein
MVRAGDEENGQNQAENRNNRRKLKALASMNEGVEKMFGLFRGSDSYS